MVGISTDSVETQRRFKTQYHLPFTLLSDAGGTIAKRYGGTMPVVGYANRATYVVGRDGTIRAIATGKDAIDPQGAIASCPVRG